MHILLTGASGLIGSYVLTYLVAEGHQVTAVDVVPSRTAIPPGVDFQLVDLSDVPAVARLFSQTYDGVIHLGAIPAPTGLDERVVHNVNVTSNYNVIRTAADKGIRRIVQASSVNAVGLTYTPAEHRTFEGIELPLTETSPYLGEDGYAVSKEINEIQANSIVRLHRSTRIASLRFHMAKPTYASAVPFSETRSLWSWVSLKSCATACLRGLMSEGWTGHEAFNVVAPEICWHGEGGPGGEEGISSLDLLRREYPQADRIREGWWTEGSPRRVFWDTSKIERVLGWKHEEE